MVKWRHAGYALTDPLSGGQEMARTALVLLMLCLPFAAAKARDLRFITIDAAPWASLDPATQKPVGVFPAVMAEFQRRTGHSIAIALHPFARIDRELETGAQDCTIIVWNDQRNSIVQKGELLAQHAVGIIAAKGVALNGPDSLPHLKGISVLRGLTLGGGFDNDLRLRKEYDTDYQTGLRKLVHGRVEAVAGAMPTIRYLAAQMGLQAALGDQLLLSQMDLVLQCSLKSPHLNVMDEFNQAIRAMRDDGTLEAIFRNNYFS